MLRAVLEIALILPFGEPREGFFDDTVLGLLGAEARARGHAATMLRVYYDGHDAARDAEVRDRLAAWLDARGVDLVVVERLFDPTPLAGRRVVQITRGDSVDPIEGVELVIGASSGVTKRGTTRTPGPGALSAAFGAVLEAIATDADALDVPGVAPPGELARAPLADAPLPNPFAPLVHYEAIALDAPPAVVRRTVYGNLGCPYAADPMKNPRFEGVRLPTLPMAKLGCAFCSMGGDYEKRPDDAVVAEVLRQAEYFLREEPELEELLLNDQHALRYLESLMREASALPPTRWLFAARADAFVRERAKVERAIEAARASGHQLEVYLSGFESFSDDALERYNKGVRADELVQAVHVMRELATDAPDAFHYARARGHSLLLWSPWTTPEELGESAEVIRRHGLAELFDELGKNRLRLYADLPITYAAERDGAVHDGWAVGDEGAGRAKGYNVERPWRFLDARTEQAHAAAEQLRKRLGSQTEVAQLLALSAAVPDDLDAGLDRLEASLGRLLMRERAEGMPPRASKARASVVSFAGACNNGCATCAQRDAWLDDRAEALLARVDAAREHGRPLLFAGREPTVHPAFGELLARARGTDGREVGVVSNGRRFAYERFARASVARGLRAVSVKLFGVDAPSADALSRDPGGFAQARDGLRNLAACAREIRAPLHADNLVAFAEYAALAASHEASLRVEVALDAVGLTNLERAARAVDALAEACAQRGVPLEASPLRAGTRHFEWLPVSGGDARRARADRAG